VETTYLFNLRFVLVLMMVRSRPHYLRHQCQISIFESSNHIHHHTYFKNPYIPIQVFHILHHHTMKLLQTFNSLQAAQLGNENWFAVGCTLRERKLIRCRHFNFGSECYLAAANTLSATNANSLHGTQFRQWIAISLQSIHFRQWTLIRSRTTQIQQRMLIRCS